MGGTIPRRLSLVAQLILKSSGLGLCVREDARVHQHSLISVGISVLVPTLAAVLNSQCKCQVPSYTRYVVLYHCSWL